ncbi:hypothetical protein GCM10010252_03640 [Streptomyces aureoverticillatus]|nr:hypothetical protein GCM10010252_03640 [Streptomyces aureoverticillatus]
MADVQFDGNAKVDALLDEVPVRLPSAAEVRARSGRRSTRRRGAAVAAVVAVLAAGAVTWAALPHGGDEQDVRPARTPEGPAFVVSGMPRILPSDQVPDNARWNWHTLEDGENDEPLPRAGGPGVCPESYRARKTPEHTQFSGVYYSEAPDRDASASHRVVEYPSATTARRELAAYQDELLSCGLHFYAGKHPHWSGSAKNDGSKLHVTAERSGRWISVVEVVADPEDG